MALLAGRRAVVTGGGHGIGRAVALRFAAEGARVAILDRDGAAAQSVAKECGGVAIEVDVSDGAACEAAIARAAGELGGLSTLVNNAGLGLLRPIEALGPKDVERMLGVNLASVVHATRAALPLMRRSGGGAIVNNASMSGVRPTPGESIYAAAKAAVIAFTAATANECGPDIRANVVSPGVVRTRMTEGLFQIAGAIEPVLAATPLRRAGTAEEVADVVLFLASDLARYVTGQNVIVDGGLGLPQAGIDPLLKGLLEQMAGAKPRA
jgi:NAD(P)-dependent dehydrogenase (short-subunit alcohol dehydrogenase family)